MNALRVSIIIPTYGREAILCQTLQYVLEQDRPADEILVIDQTPRHEPETEAFLHHLVAAGKIRLVPQGAPSASRARNRGILEATGDVLIFIDDDVAVERDFVRAHLENYRDETIAAVAGAIWSERGVPLPPVRQRPAPARRGPLSWMDVPPNLAFRTEKILLPAGNCSVRRAVALRVGGFDENYGRYDYHADYDFGWRIHRAGGKIIHDPRAGIHHLVAPRGGCRVERAHRRIPEVEELRPKFYFYAKHFPTPHSLIPIYRLLRQHVINRANVLDPPSLLVAFGRALVALGKAVYDARIIGERSLVRDVTRTTVCRSDGLKVSP